ncbi:MAG: hypothetical protein KatS3mg102_2989 [Planctomycetota bacterium]|nr:MAG: hypothetical protein KatS3mg102_2989 [Planctomycetota bacterium]
MRKDEPFVELDPADEQRNVRRARAQLEADRASLAAARAVLARREAELELLRREAPARLESARAELAAAEARLRRTEELHARALASPEVLEEARAVAAAARAALAAARNEVDRVELEKLEIERLRQEAALRESAVARSEIALEEAEERLAETRIACPIDGVLLVKDVEQGQIIASGITNFGGGTKLATVADLDRLFVVANVDEADIGLVRRGQQARVRCDAFRDVVFAGRVERILPQAVVESNVTQFQVRVEILDERRQQLLPGMTANVEIVVARREDAVLVPNRALVARGEAVGVEVVGSDGMPIWRAVERGLTDGTRTVIEHGLEVGAKVVLGTVREPPRGGGIFFFGRRSSEQRREQRAEEAGGGRTGEGERGGGARRTGPARAGE